MAERDKIHIIKYAPPPAEVPQHGRADPRAVSFIGRTNYEGVLDTKRFIFGIQREDRRRHLYVVGKTGVGKSKLLELLARQDIAYGYGLCLIDPHGETLDEVLDFIPEERIKDVVLIDPSDMNFPISFNPLVNVRPELKHQLAQGLIEVMEKQFGANWTPRLEHVFRFTVLALLDYPEATMRGMISMLADRAYRQKVIEYIEDDMVKRFFAIEFADWSEKFDTEAIIPLINKLGQFLSNPLLRHIFAQKENTIDIEAIMGSRKILLINLSKGKLGEENSSFFGSMFVTKLHQAGMARASMPPAERKDFYIYVDEFHNLVTATFVNLFTESRKYGMAMTVANQYLAQLLAAVQSTVLGNVGTLVVFRVSGEDAEKLESEMTPTFEAKDMINLGLRQFYIKMTISGESFDPFSAETLKVLPPPHRSFKNEIIAHCRQTYARPLEEVKKKIAEEEKRMIFGKNEAKGASEQARSAGESENRSSGPPAEKNDMPEPLI